eukprot:1212661-Pleurochrysis_carterae.AAC.4
MASATYWLHGITGSVQSRKAESRCPAYLPFGFVPHAHLRAPLCTVRHLCIGVRHSRMAGALEDPDAARGSRETGSHAGSRTLFARTRNVRARVRSNATRTLERERACARLHILCRNAATRLYTNARTHAITHA